MRDPDPPRFSGGSLLFAARHCEKTTQVQNSLKSPARVAEAARDEVYAMFRRATSLLLLGTALGALGTGCRSSCGSGHSWFTSNVRSEPPCQLTSNGKLMEGCFDPVTGRPIPCPPTDSTILIPGGTVPPGPAPRPDELPYPAPGDMIPRQGVPYAPPSSAPGMEGAAVPPKGGTVVKGTTAKQ